MCSFVRRPGDAVKLHVFRRDELMSFSVVLAEAPADKVSLKPAIKAGAVASKLRRGWLGGAA